MSHTSLFDVLEDSSFEAYLAMKSKLGILLRYSELGLAGQELIALPERTRNNNQHIMSSL